MDIILILLYEKRKSELQTIKLKLLRYDFEENHKKQDISNFLVKLIKILIWIEKSSNIFFVKFTSPPFF